MDGSSANPTVNVTEKEFEVYQIDGVVRNPEESQKTGLPLDKHSEAYIYLHQAFELATEILGTVRGKKALEEIGQMVIEERLAMGDAVTYPERDEVSTGWDRHITSFLQRMKHSPPLIFATNCGNDSGDGCTQRRVWYDLELGDDNYKQYDPRLAGHMELNKTTICNLGVVAAAYDKHKKGANTTELAEFLDTWLGGLTRVEAEEVSPATLKVNRDTFRFQLTSVIAHELVHFFVGYVTGGFGPPTPPKVRPLEQGDDALGESGWKWEESFWGGRPEWFEKENSTLKKHQAGMPFLIVMGDDGHRIFQRIQLARIEKILNGENLNEKLRFHGKPLSRNDLWLTMQDVRRGKGSPESGGSSSMGSTAAHDSNSSGDKGLRGTSIEGRTTPVTPTPGPRRDKSLDVHDPVPYGGGEATGSSFDVAMKAWTNRSDDIWHGSGSQASAAGASASTMSGFGGATSGFPQATVADAPTMGPWPEGPAYTAEGGADPMLSGSMPQMTGYPLSASSHAQPATTYMHPASQHGQTMQGYDLTMQGYDLTMQGYDLAMQAHDQVMEGHQGSGSHQQASSSPRKGKGSAKHRHR